MSKLGQKEAVINEIMAQLPTFVKHVDNALLKLSSAQLEAVKTAVGDGIISGNIEYSKDITKTTEVRSYARSMVMNHIKKAKELNGGNSYVSNPSSGGNASSKTIRVKEARGPKGVELDLLPEELSEFVKNLS